jgi:aspartokinase
VAGGIVKKHGGSQYDKYVAFKAAYAAVKRHQTEGNVLAAYVVAFSIIEDRINALYFMWQRHATGVEPTERQMHKPFAAKVRSLHKVAALSAEVADRLLREASDRNALFHSAMWNLDQFTSEALDRVVALARDLEKIRQGLKKKTG